MPQSAITILTRDHRAVEALFKRFEKTTPRALKTRAALVARITRELSVHAAVEETAFYPWLRRAGTTMSDEVLEGLEEHHVIKELLAELAGMDPSEERFEAKVTVLMEQTRHHVREEEADMFPRAKKALTEQELQERGVAIRAARRAAPTRPHPHAPDEPPGNLANPMVAGIDAARDAGEAVVEAAGRAVRDARSALTGGR